MTRLEAFDDLKEMIITNINKDHIEYTTSDRLIMLDLLDDIERLLKG